MNAIIFGNNGQDGHYLTSILESKKIDTIGVSRSSGLGLKGDITDKAFVNELIKQQKPDFVFHLAANSSTSFNALFENHETISTGSLILLDAVRTHSPESKVFITGSGVQFKNKGMPIKETDEFEGNSPYSVSRIHSVYAARYFRSLGLKVYVGFLFHHESPFRKPHHLSKKIIDFVKLIKVGENKTLEIGDVTVKKEWAYAKDIAEGIFTFINQDSIFETVIGTGVCYTVEDWLTICFDLINKEWQNYIIIPDKNFNSEYKVLVSDPATIFSLGWKPKTDIRQLSELMLRS